jgi:hypothetical protein
MKHHAALTRRSGVALVALALAGALLLTFTNNAGAVTVPNILLASAADYSVLGGQSVTNAGNTTMHENLGVSPGLDAAITGFPPGQVLAPGVKAVAAAAQAQLDLTDAFVKASNRPVTAIKGPDLSGLTLQGGVYHAAARAALILPVDGVLTLDGEGKANTVFIFQTDTTLTTFPRSRVRVINGAQECNVYWEVLSSANLGSSSTFVGNLMALTTITMQDDVTVHGRALARNGSVTLINDHFTPPTCATSLPTTTTSSIAGPATTAPPGLGTTLPGGGTTPTLPGGGPAPTLPGGAPAPTLPGSGVPGGGVTTTTLGLTVGIVGPPRTGVAPLPPQGFPWPAFAFMGVAVATMTTVSLRRRMRHSNAQPIG